MQRLGLASNKLKGVLCQDVQDVQDVKAPNHDTFEVKKEQLIQFLKLLDDFIYYEDPDSKYAQLTGLEFFDRLPPTILVVKCAAIGLQLTFLGIVYIGNSLSERKRCVKVNDAFSSCIDILVGGLQGTVLGPISSDN